MDSDVIEIFSGNLSKVKRLQGGQNTSILSGNIVIKPIDDNEMYCWLADELVNVNSKKVILASPIKSNENNYLYKGYGATKYIKCHYYPNRLKQKLLAADEFHRITRSVIKPCKFDAWTSPWSEATKIAWQKINIPQTNNEIINSILANIINEYKVINLEKQFIHSDLAGNIFFKFLKTVVIDISPQFKPVEYAHTLLVTDSIAWHGANIKSLRLLKYEAQLKRQLILRAVVFRLCVPLCFHIDNVNGFMREYDNFKTILEEIGIRDLTTAST